MDIARYTSGNHTHLPAKKPNVDAPQPTAQATPQMLFFRAATQYALTTVDAGFAFTMTTLPNTSRLPALVAGFLRVFNMHRPGMVNLPFFFTWLVANSARLSSAFLHTAGFNSVASASA